MCEEIIIHGISSMKKIVQIFFMLCSLLMITPEAQNIGYFWHVTDFHYDNTYSTTGLSCNGPVPRPGRYGDYWCDSPWTLVQSAINFMGQKTAELSSVDFAIWTGDTVAHIKNKDTDLDQNMIILKNTTNALEEALPGLPVYASLGNHDFYPDAQAETQQDEFYTQVGHLWQDWISNQSQVHRFESGGFYSKTFPHTPNIRLLALNTNLYYTSNKLTSEIKDPAGQFVWMETQLREARAARQKVLVTGHIPPGLLTPGLVEWFYPAHKRRFMDIILSYSNIITAAHFGHDHEDGFKILQNSDGSKSVAQFSAPSVTPWRAKFTNDAGELQTGKAHNPGVRLVKYNRDTGAQLDYTQYFINLTDYNSNKQSSWTELYRFTDAYNVTDLSVASLRKIFSRIRDGGGRQYTSKFCRYGVVSRLDKPCTDQMKGEIYCGGLWHNKTEAMECVQEYLQRINGAGYITANLFLVLVLNLFLNILPQNK